MSPGASSTAGAPCRMSCGWGAESRCSSSFLPRGRRRRSHTPGCSPWGCPCPRSVGGLRSASSEAPPTLCSICKKNSRRSDTFQLLPARWQKTNQLDAGTGQSGAPGQSLAGGSSWKWWRWIHTWGMCSCPADGVGSSQWRSESRRQWQKCCLEEDSGSGPPPEGGSGKAPLLGPAPALPAQRRDCLPAPAVPLRAAAQRGFSAPLNDRSVPFPSGRSRCVAPALARSPAAGNLPAAGRRPEKGALCAGHQWPYPVLLEMSKGSRMPSARGLCGGGSEAGAGGVET